MAERGVRGLFASLTSRTDSTVLYECRRCGTTLDAGEDACPSCESSEVERFVI